MFHQGFYRSGTGYVSYSQDHYSLSPAYVVASATLRLINDGQFDGDLPNGYTVETMEQIVRLTGTYGDRVNVSPRQANELADIAVVLQDEFRSVLTAAEQEAITALLSIVAIEK